MHYTFRNSDKIPYFKTKHYFFKNSFFPSVIIEWNKLDPNLWRCDNYNVFKNNIPKFIQPFPNSFFHYHNKPIGIKYITQIQLGPSHLREHKFKHSFQDTLNPICNCGNYVEPAIHFFLHCPLYSNERRPFLSSSDNIDHQLLDNTNFSLTQTLLFSNTTFNAKENTKIINLTIDFVLSTKRFDEPLLWIVSFFCLLPLITIHQITKESYPSWVQDSWDISDYLAAGSNLIIPHWFLFSMSWKS